MSFFFFNHTATTEIYTLSLHDALPIFAARPRGRPSEAALHLVRMRGADRGSHRGLRRCALHCVPSPCASRQTCYTRSEEHTSELQSRLHLVCRLLLEKKKKKQKMSLLT